MKTLLMAIVLLFACATVQSQDLAKFVAEKIIENADGVVVETNEEEAYIVAELPDHYDFQLFQMIVRNVVNKYDDVEYLTNWTRSDSKHPANWVILMMERSDYVTEHLRIYCSTETPLVMFFYSQDDEE